MIVADGSIKLNLLETAERIKRRVDPSLNCGWPLLCYQRLGVTLAARPALEPSGIRAAAPFLTAPVPILRTVAILSGRGLTGVA